MKTIALLIALASAALAAAPELTVKTTRVHPQSVLVVLDGPSRFVGFNVILPTRCGSVIGPRVSATVGRERNLTEPVAVTLAVPEGCVPQFVTVTPLTAEVPQLLPVEW